MPNQANNEIEWRGAANTDSRSIIRVGFWSVAVLMVVFLLWSVFFPLSSAVITPGTFVADGANKLLQHASGGRITRVYVTEGQFLEEGQPVIEIDRSKALADSTALEARHDSLTALLSRLDAERSGGLRTMMPSHRKPSRRSLPKVPDDRSLLRLRPSVDLLKETPKRDSMITGTIALRGGDGAPVLLWNTPPPIQPGAVKAVPAHVAFATTASAAVAKVAPHNAMLAGQQQAYRSGQTLLAQEIEALEHKVETLRKQKSGIGARIASRAALLDSNQGELERLAPLVRLGYVARNRLGEKNRLILELEGAIAGLKLDSLSIENQIDEVHVQIRKARTERATVAALEYTRTSGELAEISDQLAAARGALKASILRAPVSGTLLQLKASTVGGVIGAGDVLGEVVPLGAPLVVQARVQPGDIDYVNVGQTAEIVVTAFNRRLDDSLQGTVIFKSADAGKDEKTGESYFTVRLGIDGMNQQGRSRLGDIQAGMQSEVYIHTGARTFMTYMVKPMIDSFRRAFREQ